MAHRSTNNFGNFKRQLVILTAKIGFLIRGKETTTEQSTLATKAYGYVQESAPE
jgi:hypothetical protein